MKKRIASKKKLSVLNENKSGAIVLPQILNTNSTKNLALHSLPQIFNNNDPYNIEADSEIKVKPKQRIEVFKSVLNGIERKSSAHSVRPKTKNQNKDLFVNPDRLQMISQKNIKMLDKFRADSEQVKN